MTSRHLTHAPHWFTVAAALLIGLVSISNCLAQGENLSFAGAKLVAPFFSGAFPTGRFGETDPDSNKAGHNAGFSLGLESGFFINEMVAVGVGIEYAKFKLDFEGIESGTEGQAGRTTVPMASLWTRLFFPNAFPRWRPYAILGLGIGRPRGTVDFPVAPDDSAGTLKELQSTISISIAVSGGIGIMVPVSNRITLMVEPRYWTISTEATNRTDKYTFADGQSEEFTHVTDEFGNVIRLKAKSNTNWWEIRGGLVLTIR